MADEQEIRTQAELAEAFARRGWTVRRDETSMPFGERRVGDRVLCAILTKRGLGFPFAISGWVTTDALSAAETMIHTPRKRFSESCPLVMSPEFNIDKPVASQRDIDRASDDWIAWGESVDIAPGFTALLDKDSNMLGAYPLRHLAALAAQGEVEVLEHYSERFAAGDRLDFVPYITTEYVETALDFAKQRRRDPSWLPRTPKMRV